MGKILTTFLTTLYGYLGLIGVNWEQGKNKKKPCDTNDFVDITRLTAFGRFGAPAGTRPSTEVSIIKALADF